MKKSPLLISRRKLIKAAPLVLVGAATLWAMPKRAEAFLSGASAAAAAPFTPSQPTPANTWGYSTLALWDDFNSTSTIDVNNTLDSGFKWYTRYLQTATITTVIPPTGLSVNGSVLTITPDTTGGWLTTKGCIGTRPNVTLVGDTLQTQGGAYYECRMSYNAALKQNPWWPAFFTFDNQLTLSLCNSLTFRASGYAELDAMEAVWNGSGNPILEMTRWTWYSAASQIRNTNYTPNVGTAAGNDGLMHSYGLLHVPQALNGGTGLIQAYFDGVHQAACDITYTTAGVSPQENGSTAGWMSCLESTPIGTAIQIGSGNAWPINVDYVMVWTT